MLSKRDSQPDEPDARTDWSDTTGPAETPTTRRGLPTPQLLQQIIAAADQELQSADRDQALRQALDDVGRRYPDSQLCVDPVLLELVNTVLGRMSHLGPTLGPRVAEFVAQTLYEDPVARVRVERLWQTIRGRVSHE